MSFKPLVLSVFLFSSVLARAKIERSDFAAKDLTRAKVHNLSGLVRVEASSDGRAHLAVERINWHKGCDIGVNAGIDVLEVKVEDNSDGSFSRQGCRVNLKLRLPVAVNLEIKSGSGNVDVSGIEGAIDFKIGSGDVSIHSKSSVVSGTNGSGNIEILGEVSSTSLRTGSGNVKIVYNNPIAQGLIDIKTGSGNVDVALPSSMRLLTDFRAGSGILKNDFQDDQSATFKLSMRAGSGDLRVRKLN